MLVLVPVLENLVEMVIVRLTPFRIVPRPQVIVVPEEGQPPLAPSLPVKLPEKKLAPAARGIVKVTF